MSKDLILAIQAAKDAGRIILEAYGRTKEVIKKGTGDFVTATDVRAEQAIVAQLQQTGYSILAEETGEIDNKSEKKWVIDPLDGTSNFIRGFPFFAVSIALLEGEKTLLLGVVYDPVANECYWAEKGKGAYMNGVRISVSRGGKFEDSVLLIDHGRSEQSRRHYIACLQQLTLDSGAHAMRHGSTALMLCHMASGKGAAFLSVGDELYDYAGGLIIADEAGADISDWRGKPWDNSSSYILAANPGIHKSILERISNL